jgi:hypothetical protein
MYTKYNHSRDLRPSATLTIAHSRAANAQSSCQCTVELTTAQSSRQRGPARDPSHPIMIGSLESLLTRLRYAHATPGALFAFSRGFKQAAASHSEIRFEISNFES